MELKSELNSDALETVEIEFANSVVVRSLAQRMIGMIYDNGVDRICPELRPLAEKLVGVANEIAKDEAPRRELTIPSSAASS